MYCFVVKHGGTYRSRCYVKCAEVGPSSGNGLKSSELVDQRRHFVSS